MTYETKIKKDKFNGWIAETEIPVEKYYDESEKAEVTRVFAITTSKSSRGLVSRVSVHKEIPQDGYISKVTTIFQDYYKIIMTHDIARVTSKAIQEAHNLALESVPVWLEDARAHNWLATR